MQSQWLIRRVSDSDYGQIARVHVNSWRTTYRGIVPDDFLDELSYETSEARWRRISAQNGPDYAMLAAEDESGHIVGFANGGRERSGDSDFDGEMYAIYLLESHQRQGIGRALFLNIVRHLVGTGFHSMLIWVLADNPAYHFYESMGGVRMREQDVEIGGKRLKEIGYGWTNLQAIERFVEELHHRVTRPSNSLPIRRLQLEIGKPRELVAAWLRFPDLRVVPMRIDGQ